MFGCTPKRVSSQAVRKHLVVRRLAVAALLVAAAPAIPAQSKLSDPSQLTETAPDVYRARFETSKGAFVIEVNRAWAPLGADRFYNLVKNGFYDGTRFFRVRPGFVVQWGLNGDPAVQSAWRRANLQDDPRVKSNRRGFVTFAKESLPHTRSTQIFINYADNDHLDAEGFVPFGQVVSGMQIAERFFAPPRDKEPDQRRILTQGNEYLQKEFPQLDFVKKATIVPDQPVR